MKAWSLAWNTAEVRIEDSQARVVQVRRTGKGCLSYILESEGEAVVEPEVYLKIADDRGWKITGVLETQIHADHLSRSRSRAGQPYTCPSRTGSLSPSRPCVIRMS